MSDNVIVAVRCRPFNGREIQMKTQCVVEMVGKTATVTMDDGETHSHSYDHCYWSHNPGQ